MYPGTAKPGSDERPAEPDRHERDRADAGHARRSPGQLEHHEGDEDEIDDGPADGRVLGHHELAVELEQHGHRRRGGRQQAEAEPPVATQARDRDPARELVTNCAVLDRDGERLERAHLAQGDRGLDIDTDRAALGHEVRGGVALCDAVHPQIQHVLMRAQARPLRDDRLPPTRAPLGLRQC